MSFPITENEAERLRALYDLRLLDAEPIGALNTIADLARERFGVPIALVSLVDREVQVFKARCGLDLHDTPREFAFCSHAILHDNVFVVADTSKDPRFAANPLVTGEPFIRFY